MSYTYIKIKVRQSTNTQIKGQVHKMKEYRVDTFSDHEKHYFYTEKEAIEYGRTQVEKGKVAFLLKHLINNKYDVVSEIK